MSTELATAVKKEAENPDEHSANFYDLFLNHELHICGMAGDHEEGEHVMDEGAEIMIEQYDNEGEIFVYMFDSKERLAEFHGEEKQVLSMIGFDWLNILKGGPVLVLNPEDASQRVFEPEEVDWLLSVIETESPE